MSGQSPFNGARAVQRSNRLRDDRRTSDAVFRHARDLIVSGAWGPGTRVDQEVLAQELQVSRTPIREAMLRLEADGFIEKAPYKGSLVRGVDLEFVEEVFAIRISLEGLGARLAARHRSQDHLQDLEGLLHQARAEAAKHDWDWEANLNDRFHLLIPEAGGAVELGRLLAPLLRHTERFLMMFHLNLGLHEVEHSHVEMVRQIAVRHEDGAEQAIHAHLLELFAVMMRGRLQFEDCRFLPAILNPAEQALVSGYLDASTDGARQAPST